MVYVQLYNTFLVVMLYVRTLNKRNNEPRNLEDVDNLISGFLR